MDACTEMCVFSLPESLSLSYAYSYGPLFSYLNPSAFKTRNVRMQIHFPPIFLPFSLGGRFIQQDKSVFDWKCQDLFTLRYFRTMTDRQTDSRRDVTDFSSSSFFGNRRRLRALQFPRVRVPSETVYFFLIFFSCLDCMMMWDRILGICF